MAYEEPSFAVVQTNESYEIRYYNERIVVQTNNTSQNSGFRKLFNYISGKNSNSEKIAMTVPVTQTNNLMQFYLPIKFDHENTPIPTDIDVNISTSRFLQGITQSLNMEEGRQTLIFKKAC